MTTAVTITATTATTAATTEAVTASQPLETYAPGRPERGAARAYAAELFHEHGAAVERLCRALLRDSTEAEDALQQSFLSAYRSLLGGTAPRDPVAWLMTIARRECLLRIRRRMRDPVGNGVEAAAAPVDTHAEAVRRSELRALWRELHALPQRQRDALLLREVQGLTYDELARELAVTEPAVESLLLRARRQLRGRLSAGFASLPLLVRGALERLLEVGGVAGGVKLATLPVAAKVVTAGIGAAVVAGVAYEAPREISRPAAAPRPAVHVRDAAARRPAVQPPVRAVPAVPVVRETPAAPTHRSRRHARPAATTSHRGRSHHGHGQRQGEPAAASEPRGRDHDSDDTVVVAVPAAGGHEGSDRGHDGGSGESSPSSSGPGESGGQTSHGGDGDPAVPTVTVATRPPDEPEATHEGSGSPEGSEAPEASEAPEPSEGSGSSTGEAAAAVTSESGPTGSGETSGGDGSSSSGSSSSGGSDSSGHGGSGSSGKDSSGGHGGGSDD
jgi:RNA polymerase sigma factor (sigma-70 family)